MADMGHLSLIIGCMFAQKTTELLRRIRRYKSIGYKVLVVNYSEDTRYGKECIASHDKVLEQAVCVNTLASIQHLVQSGDYQVVAIDEGQFFPDLYHSSFDLTFDLFFLRFHKCIKNTSRSKWVLK